MTRHETWRTTVAALVSTVFVRLLVGSDLAEAVAALPPEATGKRCRCREIWPSSWGRASR